MIQLLLAHGACPDIQNGSGKAAVHSAAQHGALYSIYLLAAYGANMRAVDCNALTPHGIAKMYKHEECVKVLEQCIGKSLKNQCRLRIKSHLRLIRPGRDMAQMTTELGLPLSLVHYLMFDINNIFGK